MSSSSPSLAVLCTLGFLQVVHLALKYILLSLLPILPSSSPRMWSRCDSCQMKYSFFCCCFFVFVLYGHFLLPGSGCYPVLSLSVTYKVPLHVSRPPWPLYPDLWHLALVAWSGLVTWRFMIGLPSCVLLWKPWGNFLIPDFLKERGVTLLHREGFICTLYWFVKHGAEIEKDWCKEVCS